jgi:Zn-dependent protease
VSALRFRLLGVPVQILPGFWVLLLVVAALVGGSSLSALAIVSGVAFVSLLVHELGHAFAALRTGYKPAVTLHLTGGLTTYAALRQVSRGRDALISAAGPTAGLCLALLAYVLMVTSGVATPRSMEAHAIEAVSPLALLLQWTIELNVFWSVMNLLPVVPFDGGRILLSAVGDRRGLAAGISLSVGLLVALLFLLAKQPWPGLVFALTAVMSFMRLQQTAPASVNQERAAEGLEQAERALQRGAHQEARRLAEQALLNVEDVALRRRAVHVLLWALLAQDEVRAALALLDALDEKEVDAYVLGAVFHRAGERQRAAQHLEQARAEQPQRVDVAALLARVYFEAQRWQEAAEITLQISEQLPPSDVRQVAEGAASAGATLAAARLYLRLAEEEQSFRDAAAAVRAFGASGNAELTAQAYRVAAALDVEQARALLADARVAEFCAAYG